MFAEQETADDSGTHTPPSYVAGSPCRWPRPNGLTGPGTSHPRRRYPRRPCCWQTAGRRQLCQRHRRLHDRAHMDTTPTLTLTLTPTLTPTLLAHAPSSTSWPTPSTSAHRSTPTPPAPPIA